MSKFTQPPHVSLHLPPGLASFGDACGKSDNTTSVSSETDSEEEHTLTAFGDISLPEEKVQCSEICALNRLRLKVKRPPFPKKRASLEEGSFSPMSPTSPLSPPVSPSIFIDALNNRIAAYRARSDAVDYDGSHVIVEPTSPGTQELPSPTSSTSSGRSVIVKAVPSVAESPEQPKGWRKLPPRLPIPKWDADD